MKKPNIFKSTKVLCRITKSIFKIYKPQPACEKLPITTIRKMIGRTAEVMIEAQFTEFCQNFCSIRGERQIGKIHN